MIISLLCETRLLKQELPPQQSGLRCWPREGLSELLHRSAVYGEAGANTVLQ